jgi:hypothetical protein
MGMHWGRDADEEELGDFFSHVMTSCGALSSAFEERQTIVSMNLSLKRRRGVSAEKKSYKVVPE